MSGIFSLDNDVFASFVFYGSLALGKTLLMSSLTGIYRNLFKSMISKEDAIMIAPNNPEKQKRLLQPHESVERGFLAFRLLHTFIYVKGVRQPARVTVFMGGYVICISMLIQTIAATYKHY